MTVEVGFIKHEEAIIQHFVEDIEFADLYLQSALDDGDEKEIQEVQYWYDEAKKRAISSRYWSSLIENAEQTARDGQNIETVIGLLTRAIGILKAAVPANT